VHEARKEHGLLPDLVRIREPGFLHQGANSVFGVVREARVGMKQTGQEAVRAGLSTSEVEQVKKAWRGTRDGARSWGSSMKLFDKAFSPYAFKVRAALYEKGVAFEKHALRTAAECEDLRRRNRLEAAVRLGLGPWLLEELEAGRAFFSPVP